MTSCVSGTPEKGRNVKEGLIPVIHKAKHYLLFELKLNVEGRKGRYENENTT